MEMKHFMVAFMVTKPTNLWRQKGMIFMARHGENIRKRKDGRWEGRYPVYSMEKKKQVYCSVYGRTYDDVREKLTIKKNLLKNHTGAGETVHEKTCSAKEVLFTQAARDWLAQIMEKRKLSTYVKYSLIYQNHIESNFQGAVLSEITNPFVKEKLPDSLSDSVRKSVYCVLNQILKAAAARYSLKMDPLRKPDSEMRCRPVKVFSKKEQKRIISVLYRNTDLFKMAVLCVLFTGLRLGELCALKWTDIDFENKILTVNRTVQRLYAEGHRTKTILMEMAPKSGHSRREIPLSAAVLELLIRFRSDKEYVFGGDKPMEPRTMQYHFKKILKEAGVTDMNFHILRHTFSTNCVEDGMDVKSLSELLGHSNVQITLNRYVHPSMEVKRRYMDSLSAFYGQIHGHAG